MVSGSMDPVTAADTTALRSCLSFELSKTAVIGGDMPYFPYECLSMLAMLSTLAMIAIQRLSRECHPLQVVVLLCSDHKILWFKVFAFSLNNVASF